MHQNMKFKKGVKGEREGIIVLPHMHNTLNILSCLCDSETWREISMVV